MSAIKHIKPEDLDVVILCGGAGKRLKSMIKDRPKPMAEVAGRPFLDILIDYAAAFGFKRFILCAGHMGDVIKGYYQKKNRLPGQVIILQEKGPLGTAGAIENARHAIKSSPFLVLNGDSICKTDLVKFIGFYEEKNASFSMVLARSKGGSDYGRVDIDNSGRITSFNEKTEAKQNDLINAGIYLLNAGIFSVIPSGERSSLEHDIFPKIIEEGFYGYITEEELIDIGTPDRYLAAQQTVGKPLHEKR